MKGLKKIALGLVIPISIILVWIWSTQSGKIAPSLLPTIEMVKIACIDMCKSGQLQSDLLVSIQRVLKGFLAASLLGITLGVIMGMFNPIREMLEPLITTIRQIPMIAWFPLIVLWFGIGESSKVIIIVLAAFFPVLVNTLSGVANTPEGYVEVAKLYKLSRIKTFTKLYLPHAIPQILVGLKLGLSVSWMAVVAAELVAATSGIGFRMNDARSMMRSDKVIVCMIVIGLVGILMDKLVTVLFNYLTPWQKIGHNK